MPLIIAADNLEPLNPVIGQAIAGLDPQPLQEMARRLAQAGATLLDAVSTETRYVYDGMLPLQERDAMGNVVNEYTYGLGLSGGIGGLLHLNQGGAQYAYLFDGKGNVTALLDGSTAQVDQTYQYDPFGVLRAASGFVNQPMRFSTKPYDEQTGLCYYGFRFYAPALGRWMTSGLIPGLISFHILTHTLTLAVLLT
jgi:RHS repeat-associated protein